MVVQMELLTYICTFCLLTLKITRLEACLDSTNSILLRLLPRPIWLLSNAIEDNLIYTLFENANDKGRIITRRDVATEIKNKTKTTILITHGFSADDKAPWFAEMRDNFFKIDDYNVIFLNWAKAANQSTLTSFANVKPVSEYVGMFLIQSGVPTEKLHLIGHSLGGQLVGYIGKYITKKTKKQVVRITGLDPAAPAFEYPLFMSNKDRLYKTDAQFVDIVHTNIKLYGYTEAIGHVDFYPNYGEHQPGCPKNASANLHCSHARAPQYFAESIVKKVRAVSCYLKRTIPFDKWDVEVVPNLKGETVIFGQHVDQNKRGLYFLKTNPQPPFLKDKSL